MLEILFRYFILFLGFLVFVSFFFFSKNRENYGFKNKINIIDESTIIQANIGEGSVKLLFFLLVFLFISLVYAFGSIIRKAG
jgi:hypothetical protein